MRKIDNVFYLSYNSQGRFLDLNFNEAKQRYDENNCFLMMSKTKNLFPTYKIIMERECKSNQFVFIIKKRRKEQ